MKYSLITTVFNEEKTILELLNSIQVQSKAPDEIVIVDGGSRDNTVEIIKNFQKTSKLKIKFLIVRGNRSVGRNSAIENSSGNIILCTDAGCSLDKNWVRNIISPFTDYSVDVVAGYYKSLAKNSFEKSISAYVLVMEDKIDKNNFLPATRSMAFRRSVWSDVKKFNEKLSNNEDYEFAKKLKKYNKKIYFVKNAIVYWMPRSDLKTSFIMFYRFALGDAEAKIIRPKVLLIYIRYISIFLLLIAFIYSGSKLILIGVVLLVIMYILWSIEKNYKYVNEKTAFLFLPILQFTSDAAVLVGTTHGLFRIGK